MGMCTTILRINPCKDNNVKDLFSILVKIIGKVSNIKEIKEDSNELTFLNAYYPPIKFLQDLCIEYKVDMIMVFYSFEDGTAEAMELFCEDSEVKTKTDEEVVRDIMEDVDLNIDDKELNEL